jgi:hypothetical protein
VEEALIESDEALVADEETAKVTQVSKGAFDFPTLGVTTHRAAIVKRRTPTLSAMRAEQDDAALEQAPAQRITVVSAVGYDPQRPALGSPASGTWDRDARASRFGQGYFRRGSGDKLASQRNTLAVCHHHPLRTFSTFGFTHAEPPFLALAKLPSRKTSSQLSLPWASSSLSKPRQILNQTSRCSHSCRRRQQVLAEGYSAGKSRQRAPLRSTHRIPSKTKRGSLGGRPRCPRRAGLGRSGLILSHCLSLSKVVSRIPSFPHHVRK